MGSIKQKSRKRQRRSGLRYHKRSVAAVVFVLVFMTGIVTMQGVKLQKRNQAYMTQEAELQAQIDEEKARSEEIDELKEYVGTDQYIEEIAKEKLGLVHSNEVLFKAEQ